MQWIERGFGVVPTNFNIMVDRLVEDRQLLADIQHILKEKRAGTELQSEPRIESISSFIESEIERFSLIDLEKPERAPISDLDSVFCESL